LRKRRGMKRRAQLMIANGEQTPVRATLDETEEQYGERKDRRESWLRGQVKTVPPDCG